jgi:hypothetical protein
VVAPGSTVHADEAAHWDALHAQLDTRRINHSVAYWLDGACTNQAESFLARLRRMMDGQHQHVSPCHLYPVEGLLAKALTMTGSWRP